MESHSSEAAASSASSRLSLDFTRMLQIAFRRFWIIVLCMVLTIIAGIVYVLHAKKLYTGSITVQVEQMQRSPISLPGEEPDQEDYRAPEILKTFEQTLYAGTLLVRVARENHLLDRPEFQPKLKGAAPLSDSEIAERMWSKVTVKLRPATRLIDISVDDIDPVMSCQLAGSIVDEYNKQTFEQNADISRGTNSFLQNEELRLKAEVQESETALAKYRSENSAVSLDKEQNIVVEKLKEINQQVTDAKARRLALEPDFNKIKALGTGNPDDLLSLASVSAVPEVADLRRQINQSEGDFAAVKQRYKFKHIKYIQAQSTLDKLHAALNVEVLKAAGQVTRTYQGLRDTEDQLGVALKEQENRALQLDTTAIPYAALQRQVDTSRTLYESVLAKQKETAMNQISPYDLRVVEKPAVPVHPSKPARLKVMAVAAAAGMVLGVGIVFLLEVFNHTLQTVDQAEQALNLPLLAAVPEIKNRQGLGVASTAPQKEAFRTLRTTLLTMRKQEARSFLFTSAVPNEGKSFCALNFAVNLAEQGHQILLINADLRRSNAFGAALEVKGEVGLTEFLAKSVPLAQAVYPTKVANLFFCPVGKRIGNPTTLLSNARVTDLLHSSLEVFDQVVIDTPPLNAVSDCLLIAPMVDCVCLVVRALSTPVKAVWRAGRLLIMAGVSPMGFVLNRLPIGVGAKYTHYYYGSPYFQEEERLEEQKRHERPLWDKR